MSLKSAEGRQRNKLDFVFNFVEKWVLNRPKTDKKIILYFILLLRSPKSKADERGFYIKYLILLKNESTIGRRPMEGDLLFCI